VESELRQILEAVRETAPATRAEIGDAVEQQGGTFSARAVDDAIRPSRGDFLREGGSVDGAVDLELQEKR
jgi:hypothetical protein